MVINKARNYIWKYSSSVKFTLMIILFMCGLSQLLYEYFIIKLLILILTAVLGIHELIKDWSRPLHLQDSLNVQKIEEIIQTSQPKDWTTHHPANNSIEKIYTNRPEIKLILEDLEENEFTEAWCNKPHRGKASKAKCRIVLNNTCIKTTSLLYIDDARAIIPLPSFETQDSETREANHKDYNLAKIFDDRNSLEQYLKIYGITIK